MPITSMSTVTPLSKQWTHEMIQSEAAVLTNTLDNEDVQLDNIRSHINVSLSYISNLLNLAERPWYGIWAISTIEAGAHSSGLNFIDLATADNNGLIPANWINSIKRVSALGNLDTVTNWVGNLTKWDLSKLTQQANLLNVQNRHTLAWTWHGSDILVYAGADIRSRQAFTAPHTQTYDILAQSFMLWGFRKPILDNMVPPDATTQAAQNGNYRSLVDLPDEYVDLLIKLVIQKIYTQRRERVPEALEQEVNQGVAQISQMISSELQYEAAERDKLRYGHAVRPPGAV
jgi:hypothetical protein